MSRCGLMEKLSEYITTGKIVVYRFAYSEILIMFFNIKTKKYEKPKVA